MPQSSPGPLRCCVICRLINPCLPPPSALAWQVACVFIQRPRPLPTGFLSSRKFPPPGWLFYPSPSLGFSSNSDSWGLRSLTPDQMPRLMLSCGPFSTPCLTNVILQVTALPAAWCLGVHSQTQSSVRAGNSFTLFIAESPIPIKCLVLFYSRNVCERRGEEGGGKGRSRGVAGVRSGRN